MADFSSRNEVTARKTLARTPQFCHASQEYPSFYCFSVSCSFSMAEQKACPERSLSVAHHYFLHLYTFLASISQPFLRCYQSYSLRFSALQDCFLLPFSSLGPLVMTWAGMMLRFMKFSALSCKEQSVLSFFFILFKDVEIS